MPGVVRTAPDGREIQISAAAQNAHAADHAAAPAGREAAVVAACTAQVSGSPPGRQSAPLPPGPRPSPDKQIFLGAPSTSALSHHHNTHRCCPLLLLLLLPASTAPSRVLCMLHRCLRLRSVPVPVLAPRPVAIRTLHQLAAMPHPYHAGPASGGVPAPALVSPVSKGPLDELSDSWHVRAAPVLGSDGWPAKFAQFLSPLEQPELDDRQYRLVRLANGLEALLIHDETTEKAAASLSVHVGHLSDPAELPGLAHFCEHLLFLGTQKYPHENEYNEFLSHHAGSSNAYTSMDETMYFFDVGQAHLDGALDRFAQFFIAPLFDDSCTEREIRAVDSENKKNLQVRIFCWCARPAPLY